MPQAIIQAVIENVKAAIMAGKETNKLINNGRPVHVVS